MQFDFKYSVAHLWITAVWCALGGVVVGVIAVISCWIRKCRTSNQRKKLKNPNRVRRTNSAVEFDVSALTAANKRQMFSRNRSMSSEQEHSDQSEHSEKSPLVSARIDNLARIFFSKSLPADTNSGNRDTIESILARPNIKYQYTALDSGSGLQERSPKARASRDRALNVCQQWTQHSNGRYNIIAHLDEIGSRHNKNWFLVSDATVRTDRLMTLLPLPLDCVALEELPPNEKNPKGILMELLGSLHHPYIYPVLDLGFLHTDSKTFACLVTPFNPRGSLKDLIFKSQWNDPWNRKYTKKPTGLPVSQVQRLGRQILEALLFLKERGFPLHGHLHSGNIILQNGVARLSGLENGLLGLSSRINAIMWSRSTSELDNIDVICFGHLLYEMCVGYELNSPKPSMMSLEDDLSRYPQVLEILLLIFNSPDGIFPTLEELVLCDWFRSIDLRELQGPCVSTIKPSLSKSTLNLLHAVKKRQTASMTSSFSEISSPCTPPSTPRHRRTGTIDSFDISSDSESALDEIVITSSSYDSHHYDPLQSPIHYCDNSLQSDDNTSSVITISGGASGSESKPSSISSSTVSHQHPPLAPPQTLRITCIGDQQQDIIESNNISPAALSNNQLTTEMCNYKNSKSRRLEYSLKCLKYGRSNPSQDSAFGSLTDGELSIASSSFRLSSFQSISSPIDEGCEDIIIATTLGNNEISLELGKINNQNNQNDSAISTPCRDPSPSSSYNLGVHEDLNRSHYSLSLSPKRKLTTISSSSTSNLQFDPPKILVNDQNSIYTTSPSKKSNAIEVFSQKYRVSSFEDMSPNRKNNLRNVNKMAFRSLEEERRIDSAFIPIKDRTNSENRVNLTTTSTIINQQSTTINLNNQKTTTTINNSEKYKKLTHSSFRGNDITRISSNSSSSSSNNHNNFIWQDNILYRKTKIAKSNDSLLDIKINKSIYLKDNHHLNDNIKLSTSTIRCGLNRGNSVNEISSSMNNGYYNNTNNNNKLNNFNSNSINNLGNLFVNNHRRELNTDFIDTTIQKSKNYIEPLNNINTIGGSSSSRGGGVGCSKKIRSTNERNLFSLSKLKQTAIIDCVSEDESLNNDNVSIKQQKTSSINQKHKSKEISSTFSVLLGDDNNRDDNNDDDDDNDRSNCSNNIKRQQIDNNDSSEDDSPLHHDVCKIIGGMKDNSNNEEKTPLLDSVEMSPISPNEPDLTM